MSKGIKFSIESQGCTDDDCRHLTVLRQVKTAVRRVSHELSQPMLVIKGYVELLELGKYGDDPDGLKQVIASISQQLDVLQTVHVQLKEAISPEILKING